MKEKARTNYLLEFGVPGGTKNGRAQRPAPTRFYPSRCREDKAVFNAQVKAAIHRALARAGEPPARVPHAKTVPRTVLPPLLRFCDGKEFRSVRGATKGFTFGFHRL